MKRFHFPLESVQNLRQRQLELEEAKLAPSYNEMAAIEEAEKEITQEIAKETQRLFDPNLALQSFDFEVLNQYRQFALRRRVQLNWQKQQCQQRIEQQMLRIREAKRNYELLEKLRQRELSAWRSKLNKELDALAEEVFIAKWKPRPRRADA